MDLFKISMFSVYVIVVLNVNGFSSRDISRSNVCSSATLTHAQMQVIRQQYQRYIGDESYNDESFYDNESADDLRFHDQISAIERLQYKERGTLIRGERKCKTPSYDGPLKLRATCPWYKDLTYDPDRYPVIIAKARCSCKHCYTLYDKHRKRLTRRKQSKCEPIITWRKVLRKKLTSNGRQFCENGNPVYLNTWEKVPVGCTCVMPKRKSRRQMAP